MLVLSRQKNEVIDIECGGVAISVVVVEICGDKVRLGIEAPRSVTVDRREVTLAKRRDGDELKYPI